MLKALLTFMMENDLVIIGTGGLALEISESISFSNCKGYNFLGFVSEFKEEVGEVIGSHKVISYDDEFLAKDKNLAIIVASGIPSIRFKVLSKYLKFGFKIFPNFIHDDSRIVDSVILGKGNIIMYGAYISSEVEIGNFNLINWYATIGHNAKLASYSVVNPHVHISGFVRIGSVVFIGANASVLEHCTISDSIIVGAGCLVNKSLSNIGTYVGLPVKQLK